MSWRWLRSRGLWLVVCVVVGALMFTIPSLQALHDGMEIAEAFSSGVREALKDAGFKGPPRESVRVSVTLLFGLVEIKDTPHPYLWSTIGGIVTGGGLGLVVWGLLQLAIWCWPEKGQRAGRMPDEAGAAPDPTV